MADVEELASYIGTVVEMELIQMTPVTDDMTFRIGSFSGGPEHQLLCATAAGYLDKLGRGWSRSIPYIRCPGGLADLATLDGKLVVEAGCTRAQKVMLCLEDGVQVMLVPFDGNGETALLLTPRDGHRSIGDRRRQAAERVANRLSEMTDQGLKALRSGYRDDDE